MGWFSKDKGDEKRISSIPSLPELPKLPELPELPDLDNRNREPIHQLPSFPNSSLGQKFSQNTIKSAVSNNNVRPVGKEGGRVFEADDFAMNKSRMMPKPEKKIPPQQQVKRRQEIDEEDFDMHDEDIEEEPEFSTTNEYEESHTQFEAPEYETPEIETSSRIKSTEPVFIRIDRFEASLKAFEKTKKQIAEIEKNIREISELRKEEEKEITSWQQEIMRVKELIDKVDKDIFSKIE